MKNRLAYLLPFFLVVGIASAGTVTLTGTCSSPSPNYPGVHFILGNRGNDSAYNLLLTPVVQNAQLAQSYFNASTLNPNSNLTFNISFTGIREKGTTEAYFLLVYQQGSQTFTAVFPCLLALSNITISKIFLYTNVSVNQNGNATINVQALNGGNDQIDANVSLVLPPTFAYTSNRYYLVSLAPFQAKNVTFSASFPTSLRSSYTGGAFATYSQGNLSHTSLHPFVISTSVPSSGAFGSLLIEAAVAVVAAAVALILLSLRKRRK